MWNILSLMFVASLVSGQNNLKTNFTAKYRFSWAIDSILSKYNYDDYILLKSENFSYYYNLAHQYNDSLISSFGHKEMSTDADRQRFLKDWNEGKFIGKVKKYDSDLIFIIDKKKDKEFIRFRDNTVPMYYSHEVESIKWNITNVKDNIKGISVLKATTYYGGRKYTAWFAPQIPQNEGPYVFRNLPGLIIKVIEENNNFIFELIDYNTSLKVSSLKKDLEGKCKEINYEEWVKVRMENYFNPRMNFVRNEDKATYRKNNLTKRYFLLEKI